MKYRRRIYYTAEQRSLMWDRYKQGESLHTIARLFDRYHSSVSRIIAESGGIRPPDRKRAKQALTLSEREEISRGIAIGLSVRGIAEKLKRSPSTICREINRNGGYEHYRASQAEQAAWEKAKRPKPCKLKQVARLKTITCRAFPSSAIRLAIASRCKWSREDTGSSNIIPELL